MNWISFVLAALIAVLIVAAVTTSFRRNKRDIEAFKYPDLDELRLCVANHRLKWISEKLYGLGWELVSAEVDPKDKLSSQVRFRKSEDGTAVPLKEVLHTLNRSLALPAGPMNLKCEDQEARN